jgi:creatinine amidohydrolase
MPVIFPSSTLTPPESACRGLAVVAVEVGDPASILLHAHPELVRDGYRTADWVADDRRNLLTTGIGEYTQSGVIGRPSLASAEKGKALLAALVGSFASALDILQRA